jgi:hypothetical protein
LRQWAAGDRKRHGHEEKFRSYPIGFFHIDIAEADRGTRHLFEQNRSSGAIGYLTPGQQSWWSARRAIGRWRAEVPPLRIDAAELSIRTCAHGSAYVFGKKANPARSPPCYGQLLDSDFRMTQYAPGNDTGSSVMRAPRVESSQAVALEDLLAALAKLCPMLLKALGHSHVVTQLLSGET